MDKTLPAGCGVALVTPFTTSGQVDFDALHRMVNHVITGGIDFIVALGTTGEALSLTRQERIDVLQQISSTTAGRVPLVAGPFGGGATAPIIHELARLKEVLLNSNYVAIMACVPSYVKPSQEGIYEHFMAIAKASPLPVLLYNVPSRTASHMTAATVLRLAQATKRIIGVKEASGSMYDAMQLDRERPAHFQVFSGDDLTAIPLMACGADGVISVIANAYPQVFSDMTKAALKGEFKAARRHNAILLDMHPYLYTDGNPAGIKAVLAQLSLVEDEVRLPLTTITSQTRDCLVQQVLQIEAALAPGLV